MAAEGGSRRDVQQGGGGSGGLVYFYFDSHSRPENSVTVGHVCRFPSRAALAEALHLRFPPMAGLDDCGFAGEMFNQFEAFTLFPQAAPPVTNDSPRATTPGTFYEQQPDSPYMPVVEGVPWGPVTTLTTAPALALVAEEEEKEEKGAWEVLMDEGWKQMDEAVQWRLRAARRECVQAIDATVVTLAFIIAVMPYEV